jgi:hypothetical protein
LLFGAEALRKAGSVHATTERGVDCQEMMDETARKVLENASRRRSGKPSTRRQQKPTPRVRPTSAPPEKFHGMKLYLCKSIRKFLKAERIAKRERIKAARAALLEKGRVTP